MSAMQVQMLHFAMDPQTLPEGKRPRTAWGK